MPTSKEMDSDFDPDSNSDSLEFPEKPLPINVKTLYVDEKKSNQTEPDVIDNQPETDDELDNDDDYRLVVESGPMVHDERP